MLNNFFIHTSANIQTVTELTCSIKLLLENGFSFVSVCGEISNLRKPFSGHQYFTIKDSGAQLKAVLFKNQQRYLPKDISDGMNVICRGRISVYEPRGEYQLIVDSIDFEGEGLLQAAFEQLKKKLAEQGLFDSENKKKLPFMPENIALITSPQGAAIYDFLSIAVQRFPAVKIEIYPVSVQGEKAASEIIAALNLIHKRKVNDVVVICRGGGSIEDLWPFNDEALALKVHEAEIPIISAVGHEIDFTILDFVADHRSPTPTAAAETIVPDQKALLKHLKNLRQGLISTITRKTSILRQQVSMQKRLLADPSSRINNLRMRIDHRQESLIAVIHNLITEERQKTKLLTMRLDRKNPQNLIDHYNDKVFNIKRRLIKGMEHLIYKKTDQFKKATSLLQAVSPSAVLERGYAIVQKKKSKIIISSEKQVEKGEQLEIMLHEGKIDCEVL